MRATRNAAIWEIDNVHTIAPPRNDASSRRLAGRSGDRRCRGADLSNNVLPVPRHRTRRDLFALKSWATFIRDIMDPTNDVLEKRVAALEGGVAALALASGQAASAFAIQNLFVRATMRRSSTTFTEGHGICSPTRSRIRVSKFVSSIRSIRKISGGPPMKGPGPTMPRPCQIRS